MRFFATDRPGLQEGGRAVAVVVHARSACLLFLPLTSDKLHNLFVHNGTSAWRVHLAQK